MIDMHSKYDNMPKNGMFYALICNNNHIIICINCMLLGVCFDRGHPQSLHFNPYHYQSCFVWCSLGVHICHGICDYTMNLTSKDKTLYD